jgi:hypothetical protein|tara:strand:+ start:3428 stop:4609 length:1182 start_codon:yes stop_codon:yes gene_type:complete
MAKKKKETTEEVVEKTDNTTKVDLKKTEDDNVIKVDLSKPPTPKENEEIKEDVADDGGVVELTETTDSTQEQEEVQPETETQETPVLEEVTEEEQVEELAEQIEEAITESEVTGKELPENIQKLMDFMEETGGDLEDYVKLNQDYSKLDNNALLKEYYKQTKPHLDSEEIDFLMEDNFSFDEEMDEDIDVRRKKLALKEQVAQAKQHLDGAKSKYYEDIKYGSKLTGEQQKAIDFFNRYNKESEEKQGVADKQKSTFLNKTNKLFNKEFKGFEYEVGEKKFRFNVKDSSTVKDTQSDINNFVKKFLNKNNEMEDAKGYHKSLYTAMNADKIANHFYEQGKADALKNSVAKSKNISMDPRQQHGVVEAGGIKVRVLGDDSSDFKFKIKNNKFKK